MRQGLLHASLFAALLLGPELHAQHAGAGAAAAHAGGSAHGSLSVAGASPRLTPSAQLASRNWAAQYRGMQDRGTQYRGTQYRGTQAGRAGHWPVWNGPSRFPRGRYPYVYPGFLSFGYGLAGGYGLTPDDGQSDAYDETQDAPMQEYGPPPGPEVGGDAVAEYAPPVYRTAYHGESSTQAEVHQQPATTLIFKDQRPREQVHNYVLTGSTLWALDGEARREIPLAALDIPATVEANRDAGVDFALPTSR